MPILEIEIVGRPGETLSDDLAQRIADLAGQVFAAPAGSTWVRLRLLPAGSYAENGSAPSEGIYPVFVSVLKAQLPLSEALAEEIKALTAAIAKACGRPQENVHILYLPAGRGRIAFGGELLAEGVSGAPENKMDMKIADILQRRAVPEPWAEGDKIPWDEPGFSQRMLTEHLSQAHDAASRRFEVIDRHIDWIHHHCLDGRPGRVLDLGCGPGLYTSRLVRLGHDCTGIDFSPASIEYARAQAVQAGSNCQYIQADIRTAQYGEAFDLVMLIYGEFNVFRAEEAQRILEKAHDALKRGGMLLLEPHTFEVVRKVGTAPPSWYSSAAGQGLFSERAHLVLQENFWHEAPRVAIERYYIIDAIDGSVQRHSASMQAYTRAQYRALLTSCGFRHITFYNSLAGNAQKADRQLCAMTARKQDG